jgi:hypothetical protein
MRVDEGEHRVVCFRALHFEEIFPGPPSPTRICGLLLNQDYPDSSPQMLCQRLALYGCPGDRGAAQQHALSTDVNYVIGKILIF